MFPRRNRLPRRWYLVAVLWLLLACSNAYLIAPASVLSTLMAELNLSPTVGSSIVSIAFGFQILISVPLGMWLDRIDHRWAIRAAVIGLIIAGLWGRHAALTGHAAGLIGSRMLGGAASVLVWNGGSAIIGQAFESESQASPIGIFTSGAPAGFAFGQVTGPIIAAEFHWTTVIAVYGLVTAVPLVGFTVLTRGEPLGTADKTAPELADFGRVMRNPTVWQVGAMSFTATSVYLFMNSWVPTYLQTVLSFPLVQSGLIVGVLPLIGVLARSSGGVFSDYVFGGRRRPVLVYSFLVPTPLVIAFIFARYPPVLVGMLALVGFFIQLGPGIFLAKARETVNANVAATAISFVTTLTSLGAFVAPIIAGYIIEVTGMYALAFVYAASMGVLGLVLAWRMTEAPILRDTDRETSDSSGTN